MILQTNLLLALDRSYFFFRQVIESTDESVYPPFKVMNFRFRIGS